MRKRGHLRAVVLAIVLLANASAGAAPYDLQQAILHTDVWLHEDTKRTPAFLVSYSKRPKAIASMEQQNYCNWSKRKVPKYY